MTYWLCSHHTAATYISPQQSWFLNAMWTNDAENRSCETWQHFADNSFSSGVFLMSVDKFSILSFSWELKDGSRQLSRRHSEGLFKSGADQRRMAACRYWNSLQFLTDIRGKIRGYQILSKHLTFLLLNLYRKMLNIKSALKKKIIKKETWVFNNINVLFVFYKWFNLWLQFFAYFVGCLTGSDCLPCFKRWKTRAANVTTNKKHLAGSGSNMKSDQNEISLSRHNSARSNLYYKSYSHKMLV